MDFLVNRLLCIFYMSKPFWSVNRNYYRLNDLGMGFIEPKVSTHMRRSRIGKDVAKLNQLYRSSDDKGRFGDQI